MTSSYKKSRIFEFELIPIFGKVKKSFSMQAYKPFSSFKTLFRVRKFEFFNLKICENLNNID